MTAASLVWLASGVHLVFPGTWVGAVIVLALAAYLAVRALRRGPVSLPDHSDVPGPWVWTLVGFGSVANIFMLWIGYRDQPRVVLVSGILTASAALLLVAPVRRVPTWLVPAAMAAALTSIVLLILSVPARMDTVNVLREAVELLGAGHNPYPHAYALSMSLEEADYYYGQGVVVDGRVPYQLMYPPLVVLVSFLGHLMGDLRVAGVLNLAAITGALFLMAPRQHARVSVALLLAGPTLGYLLAHGMTEGLVMAFPVVACFLMVAGRPTLAFAVLGAALVSKQYFVVTVPALWLLRPWFSRGRIVLMVGTGAALTLPCLIANPHAFLRSLTSVGAPDLVRFESLSILVAAVREFGKFDTFLMNALPLCVGFGVSALLARRLAPSTSSFAVASALSLMAFLLLSRLAFVNYYFMVGVLLWGAAVCWARGGTMGTAHMSRGPSTAERDRPR